MLNLTKNLTTDPTEFIPGKNTKEYIIIHHTGSKSSFENIVAFFLRPDYISVHYVVAKDGRITQLVDDNDVAFHAGVSSWDGKTNLNYYSIGIEVHSDGNEFTEAQREAVTALCADLMNKYDIGHRNVLKHADIAPKRKWDVGPSFYVPKWGSWPAFQDHLRKRVEQARPADELEEARAFLQSWGITNGEDLKAPATRGQVMLMLYRTLNRINKLLDK